MWYRWNPTKEDYYFELFRPYLDYYHHYATAGYSDHYAGAVGYSEEVRINISDTIETFKRRDRILYILKLQRYIDFLSFDNAPRRDFWDVRGGRLLRKYAKQYGGGDHLLGIDPMLTSNKVAYLAYKNLVRDFVHLIQTAYANDFHSILNIEWGNQNPYQFSRYLKALEEEEIRTKDEVEVQANAGQVVIEYDDGFHWTLLSTPEEMKVEAQAMRHCGQPSRTGSKLLSLRSPGKLGQRAHLTFEWIPLDEDGPFVPENWGVLGEMKGFANSKPIERYHPYIIDLLLHPCIQSIVGGGYHPESNFELDDLPSSTQTELLKIKPQLSDFKEIIKHKGAEETLKWVTSRNRELKDATLDVTPDRTHVVISFDIPEGKGRYKRVASAPACDFAEFIADYISDERTAYGHDGARSQLKTVTGYCCGENYMEFDYGFEAVSEDIYLEILKESLPIIHSHVINYYEEKGEYPDYFTSAALSGDHTGWEVGTTDIMYRKFVSLLESISWESGAFSFKDENEFSIRIHPEDLLSHYFKTEDFDESYGGIFEESTDETNNVGRNLIDERQGDQDFNEEVARETFLERIEEEYSLWAQGD